MDPIPKLGEMRAIGGKARLQIADESGAMLFGFLMEAGRFFRQTVIGGLDPNAWADAIKPRFEIRLDLDQQLSFTWMLREHEAEFCMLFDDLVLPKVRRSWLAGILIDQADVRRLP